ncbi:MAG: exopolyphosphatase [Cyclobacteriaceae bacterium]
MTRQKIAILDLGTNTFNLLMAEISANEYRIFFSTKIPVKIGMGGINDGFITQEACERALLAIEQYRNIIDEYGVTNVYGFATSAFRNASNGKALANEIEDLYKIPVSIISGDDEAEYIYHGVKSAINIGEKPSLIMDIGGGSIEIIIGDGKKVHWKQSFEIGAQRLLELFQKHDPILDVEVSALNSYLDEKLSSLQDAITKFKPATIIGSSGTFDTLSNIYCEKYQLDFKQNYPEFPLTLDFFIELQASMKKMSREERVNIPGMLEMRADMMVVACCLIEYIITKYDIKQLRVSAYSLKEGMIRILQNKMFGSLRISI